MNLRNLSRLGNRLQVSLPTDENGYTGRECPNGDCEGYFKIVFGTGLPDATECHCPYCGHSARQSDFATRDQIEYAKSTAMRKITGAVVKDLKRHEFDIKHKGPFGMGMSMKVERGRPHPIHYYREKKLETRVECTSCTLRYAVYGVFAFCPDCKQHNSLQILDKNLEVVGKMLDMAVNVQAELADRLTENALEDCVSAFDGFGRELCRVHAKQASNRAKAEKTSFQNLEGAKRNLSGLFGLDLAAGLTAEQWDTAVRGFQKRHLLSHTMGVVDQEYVRKTGDRCAVVGRKISIADDEVRALVSILRTLAAHVWEAFQQLP
jgi:hypothetical protein